MSKLSVVLPAYNEELMVGKTCRVLAEVLTKAKIPYELVVVNDGSGDRTWEEIQKAGERDANVTGVLFSRNFGKEAAIIAGLEKAKGDFTVLMDADLQDPPALLPEMYGYIEQGYDSVATRRVDRKGEPPIRSFFARRFYGLMRKISKTEIVDGARDYRLMTRQVTDAILSMREYNRFSKGIFGWVGYKTKWLEYENVQRAAGETKWNFAGWYYGFFYNAVIYCIFFWDFILHSGICLYDIYLCQSFDLWRSCSGLAFHGMYHFFYRRRSAAMSGYYGTVYE